MSPARWALKRSSAEVSRPGPNIDYFTHVQRHRCLLKSGFGIRVRERVFWVVIKVSDQRPNVLGKPHPIPVALETLPWFVRNLIDDHMREHPTCDLRDVLTGEKTFRATLGRSANAQDMALDKPSPKA